MIHPTFTPPARCHHCEHEWTPRVTWRPVQCPKCKSTTWESKPNTWFIYALIDPRTKQYFYVGKTRAPGMRFATHRAGMAYTAGRQVRNRCWELRQEGIAPLMVLIEEVPADKSTVREHDWIRQLRDANEPILNTHPMKRKP